MRSKWKKIALLTLLMGGSFAAGAWASDGIERVDAFLRPDFQVVLGGETVHLDTPPLIYNDRSYLPLKTIGQLLKADVKWNNSNKTIYILPRFEGQPDTPAQDDAYTEIRTERPFAYKLNYLGQEYGLLSVTANRQIYYRVEDLGRMGIDTRSLKKSKDVYTGFLYVTREEAMKLWQEPPAMSSSIDPPTSGIYDELLKKNLLDLAKVTIPYLAKEGLQNVPKNTQVFFIDAAAGHPGYYYLFSYNEKYEIVVFIVEMGQNSDKSWYQKNLQSIHVEYLYKFFDSP